MEVIDGGAAIGKHPDRVRQALFAEETLEEFRVVRIIIYNEDLVGHPLATFLGMVDQQKPTGRLLCRIRAKLILQQGGLRATRLYSVKVMMDFRD